MTKKEFITQIKELLIKTGNSKLILIKTIKDLTGIGLKESYDLVTSSFSIYNSCNYNATNLYNKLIEAGYKDKITSFKSKLFI